MNYENNILKEKVVRKTSKTSFTKKVPAARFEFSKNEKIDKNTKKTQKISKQIKYFQFFLNFSQNLEKQVKYASKICKQNLQVRFEFKTRQIMQ